MLAGHAWAIPELVKTALNIFATNTNAGRKIGGASQSPEQMMGIYDPLRDHLRRQRLREIEMTFAEIENLTGRSLPKSAEHPQWWANQKNGTRPQRDAWRDAGYEAFLIKGRDRVRFARVP